MLYHLIVLLTSKGYRIEDLARELEEDVYKRQLVFGQPSGNIGMGMVTYIGIYTESHIGHLTCSGSQLVDNLQLGDRLHIKAENVIIQPQIDFPISLCLLYTSRCV